MSKNNLFPKYLVNKKNTNILNMNKNKMKVIYNIVT